jgi:hypothetical protein
MRCGRLGDLGRAATWDDRAEAEAVAAALNDRDRQPESTGPSARTTGSSSRGTRQAYMRSRRCR